jgi:glycosyltransferase involved in cell wall biosynthesis
MNIIILGPREPVPPTKGGAIEKLTWGLAKGLAKYGHEVTIISTCENPISKYTTENVNIICISPPIPGSRFYFREMPLFSYKAWKTIEKLLMNKPNMKDDVIVHSVYFYNLMMFPPHNEIPLVVTEFEHYPWIPEYLYHRPFISSLDMTKWILDSLIRRELAQIIFPRTSATVFVSDYQKQMALKKLKLAWNKAITIHNAVDTNFYRPMDANKLRERLSDGTELLLLFVGRLTPHKGFHILIKSLAKLESKYRNRLRLIAIGPKTSGFLTTLSPSSDVYTQYINYLIEKYDLNKSIIFVGQVQEIEMPLYYNAVDLLVHPSFVEAFGLVLVEAMACGKPILAFNIPPMNEIIDNGISGLLTKPSVESLTEALRIINEDTKALRAIGLKARNIVEMKYSWQIILRKYLMLYDELK